MDVRYSVSPKEVESLSTDQLRQQFLVSDLFDEDHIRMTYTHEDRMVIGGIVPRKKTLTLKPEAVMQTEFFLERRELAVVNLGESGTVVVDGETKTLDRLDCLYVGRGVRDLAFAPGGAVYYLVSTLTQKTYPTQKVSLAATAAQHLGGREHSNQRTVHRIIHQEGIQSGQLVLGLTELDPGSMWNTMPAHTHDRRTEIYLYFDLDADDRVIHLMGRPEHTRHLVIADRQAVISPSWSIHSGVGTGNYTFIWAMAGENDDYSDMEGVPAANLR